MKRARVRTLSLLIGTTVAATLIVLAGEPSAHPAQPASLPQPAAAPQPAATPHPTAQPLAQALTLAGEPQTSEVMVKSEPSGADIVVNGKFAGNTPSSLRLPAGDHTITVEMSEYKTWKRTVTETPGSNVTLKATLESN